MVLRKVSLKEVVRQNGEIMLGEENARKGVERKKKREGRTRMMMRTLER